MRLLIRTSINLCCTIIVCFLVSLDMIFDLGSNYFLFNMVR